MLGQNFFLLSVTQDEKTLERKKAAARHLALHPADQTLQQQQIHSRTVASKDEGQGVQLRKVTRVERHFIYKDKLKKKGTSNSLCTHHLYAWKNKTEGGRKENRGADSNICVAISPVRTGDIPLRAS